MFGFLRKKAKPVEVPFIPPKKEAGIVPGGVVVGVSVKPPDAQQLMKDKGEAFGCNISYYIQRNGAIGPVFVGNQLHEAVSQWIYYGTRMAQLIVIVKLGTTTKFYATWNGISGKWGQWADVEGSRFDRKHTR